MGYYKFLIVLLILSLVCFLNQAQSFKTINNNYSPVSIKINIFSLIDYTPSFQVVVQYNISNKLGIQSEIGYITHYLSPFFDKKSQMKGIRIKKQVKYYLFENNKNIPFYLALDLMYKEHSYYIEEEYWRQDFLYIQTFEILRTKQVHTASLLIGFEQKLGAKGFYLDLFKGLGYRHLLVSQSELPDDAFRTNRGFVFIRKAGVYHLPNITLGLRIGYKISV